MVQPFSARAGSAAPANVPSTGNPALESFLQQELHRLWRAQQFGEMQMISLEPLGALPSRSVDGMVCYFLENVVTPQRGLYEYRNGAWSKL